MGSIIGPLLAVKHRDAFVWLLRFDGNQTGGSIFPGINLDFWESLVPFGQSVPLSSGLLYAVPGHIHG